jgi:hypothetical protein
MGVHLRLGLPVKIFHLAVGEVHECVGQRLEANFCAALAIL